MSQGSVERKNGERMRDGNPMQDCAHLNLPLSSFAPHYAETLCRHQFLETLALDECWLLKWAWGKPKIELDRVDKKL
ncbi:hypothetical protein V6N12_060937 [Hibiscus sabdariffa]|uniref:Uncharacterized protein n=1 Tax=Hibiscus sabdariffa TaxID=183260 RepID=A0ABR2DVK9_9ROSI